MRFQGLCPVVIGARDNEEEDESGVVSGSTVAKQHSGAQVASEGCQEVWQQRGGHHWEERGVERGDLAEGQRRQQSGCQEESSSQWWRQVRRQEKAERRG